MISRSHPDSVGGGGIVAEIFRDLQKPARFSGGGGVVADNFCITSPETDPIRSRERDTYHTFPHLPRYSLIDKPIWQLTYTNTEITEKKKSISNALGGARAPQAPLDPPMHLVCFFSGLPTEVSSWPAVVVTKKLRILLVPAMSSRRFFSCFCCSPEGMPTTREIQIRRI